MSGFGPPPGPVEPDVPRRPASYLPPGGLGDRPGGVDAASGGTAYRLRYAVGVSHKPGIIALKPLSAGDVLDGSAKAVRRNPGTVLGLSASVNAMAVLPALALVVGVLAGTWLQRSGITRVVDTGSLVALLLAGGTLLATCTLSGLLAPVVGEAVLGRPVDLGQAWRASRPALAGILGSAVTVCAVIVAPWVILVGAVALVAAGPVPVVLAVGLALGFAAVAVDVALVPKVLLAGPIVALERVGVRAGLRRAVDLSRGRYWSIFGVSLLALALGGLMFLFLQLFGLVVGNVTIDLLDLTRAQAASAGQFASALSTLVAATLVTPFLASSVILQYVDARMRKEGLDLVLLRGVITRTGAGS